MAESRTFTIRELDHPMQPTEGHQVVLRMFEDGRFRIEASYFYRDWGGRLRKTSAFEGRYQESDLEVVCRCQVQQQVTEESERGDMPGQSRQSSEGCDQVFVFEKIGSESVLCGVDHAGMRGLPMSLDVNSMDEFF